MDFIREHKKLSIIILFVAVILLLFGTTFARYIYNVIHNHILESREFYFNSTVLDMNGRQYRINNWDGVNNYVLTIDVNNQKNSLTSTQSDIAYDIEVSCPSSVECRLSKTEGIIPAIESAHAVAYARKLAPTMDKDQIIVITISGRGDKDCASVARYRGEDLHE